MDTEFDGILELLRPFWPAMSSSDLDKLQTTRPLVHALQQLARRRVPEVQAEREKRVAEQKVRHSSGTESGGPEVVNLRTSLSHLTTHLNTLANRLSASESSISGLRLAHEKVLAKVEQERDGLRALCGVWEGRWREERRIREEAEVGRSSGGRVLNDRSARAETSWTLLKPILPPTPSRSRHSSSASSSSSSTSNATRRTTSQAPWSRSTHTPQSTQSTPRLRTRQIVADLSRELERVRREADRLLFERDEEIVRLEADQAVRRKEMADLYGSLDTLLGLGGGVDLRGPADIPLPPDEDVWLAPDPAPPGGSAYGRSKGKGKASVLDLPSVRAAAVQSTSGRTAALEAEVRELEQEVGRMGGNLSLREPSSSSGGEPSDAEGRRYDSAALAATISDLNEEVAQLRRELEGVTHERAVLQGLYERRSTTVPLANHGRSHSSSETDAADLVAHLEADRDRYARLLRESESEAQDLATRLSFTQDQVESISGRVRMKLVEQKEKLSACHLQIEQLSAALDEVEGRLEECEKLLQEERSRNRVLEGLLGWERSKIAGKGRERPASVLSSVHERISKEERPHSRKSDR